MTIVHCDISFMTYLYARFATIFLVTISLSLGLNACSKSPQNTAESSASVASDSQSDNLDNGALSSAMLTQQDANAALENKQLVVTAQAEFEVVNVRQTVQRIEQLTLSLGGYVADSQVSNRTEQERRFAAGNQQQKIVTAYVQSGIMTLRIPKAQISNFLQQLQQQIVFLNQSQMSAKDITLDIQKADIEARIQALKAQAIEHSADGAASRVKLDAATEAALAEQQKLYAEIEAKALHEQVELSTVQLQFSQPLRVRTQIMPDVEQVLERESRGYFWNKLWHNLANGWDYFIGFVLWLAQAWLFLLFLGLAAWLWIKWRSNRHMHRLNAVVVQHQTKTQNDED